jgi:hypothetical protein
MSPYLVLETDTDKQKTDVADDAGESAAWTGPVRLSGNGPIQVSDVLDGAKWCVLRLLSSVPSPDIIHRTLSA